MVRKHATFSPKLISRGAAVVMVAAIVAVAAGCTTKPAENAPMGDSNKEKTTTGSELYEIRVPLKIEDVEAKLIEAAKAHQFGVPGSRNISALLRERGQNPTQEFWVYDVCNPQHAATLLADEPRIVSILPCRVSAFAEPGADSTTLVFVRPTVVMQPFKEAKMKQIAEEVERAIIAIVNQLAGE